MVPLIEDPNVTRFSDASALCVHQLFERQAARTPEAPAVVFGENRLSYRTLNARANQLAHFLRNRGVGPDSLVGVCIRRCPEMIVALLGVWKAGGAYVPLDPGYPRDRLLFMLGDAKLRYLLTDADSGKLFRDRPDATDGEALIQVCIDSDWPQIAHGDSGNLPTRSSPHDLAYVMYTSGSTGQPKGAMIEHAGLVNYLCWAIDAYAVQAGDSVPLHSSLSFDLTVTSLYPALLVGAEVELLAEDSAAQNLLAALRAGPRGLVKITPAHLELLNRQLRPEEMAGMAKILVIGGENLPAERLRAWREHAPATRLINEYGPTETVVGCCVHEVAPDDPHSGSVPIGRPIANTRLHVLDDDLQPVPQGAVGELFIGGAGVARGYLNRPELTQERFLPDRFSGATGARLYRTGDLVRCRSDGLFEYLGRTDHQVKIDGYRIELGEIEQALTSHPLVYASAVLARDEPTGDKHLVAYFIPEGEAAPDLAALTDLLRRRLPEYMVPTRFVVLDDFPLTANGKLDRRALLAMREAERQPATTQTTRPATPVAPRTATETAVFTIFQAVLGRSDFGVLDSFFDLGGRSLMALRLISRIESATGTALPLRSLFEQPTVAGVAEVVDGLSWASQESAMPTPQDAVQREEIRL